MPKRLEHAIGQRADIRRKSYAQHIEGIDCSVGVVSE